MRKREVDGNFGDYAIMVPNHSFPDDEEAIMQAFDHMFSMCGNAGQEAMIGDNAEWFGDWAIEALENPVARGTYWTDFASMVYEEVYGGRDDKWMATELIWNAGWQLIAEQSGYHDSHDEQGEGTGGMFR